MLNGLFFLAGLGLIVWLGYWAAQEGREKPGKRRWSPFDYQDDTAATLPPEGERAGWRRRADTQAGRSRRE